MCFDEIPVFYNALTEKLPGDDQLLNLVGALIDLGDLGVPHHALHMVVLHIAVAAQHLDCLGSDLHGYVGAGHLGHSGRYGVGLTLLLADGGLVEQELGGLNLGLELGHLKGQVLLLGNGFTELLALHHVLPGHLEGALGDAQSLGRHADAPAIQSLHGQLKALARLGDHVLSGDADIVQMHVGDQGGANAHLVFHLAHGEAGGALLHHEGGHALYELNIDPRLIFIDGDIGSSSEYDELCLLLHRMSVSQRKLVLDFAKMIRSYKIM